MPLANSYDVLTLIFQYYFLLAPSPFFLIYWCPVNARSSYYRLSFAFSLSHSLCLAFSLSLCLFSRSFVLSGSCLLDLSVSRSLVRSLSLAASHISLSLSVALSHLCCPVALSVTHSRSLCISSSSVYLSRSCSAPLCHAVSLSISHSSPALSLSLSLTLAVCCSFSLLCSFALSRNASCSPLPPSHSLSLFRAHSRFIALSRTRALVHNVSFSLPLSLPLSLLPSVSPLSLFVPRATCQVKRLNFV